MYTFNLFPYNWFNTDLSAYDLFVFATGSIVIVLLLLLYYQRISRKTNSESTLEKPQPIYTYKDVLLQQKSVDDNYFPTSTKQPLALKIIVISLILLIMITPLYKLLNVRYFL